jgi:hypothetical protein
MDSSWSYVAAAVEGHLQLPPRSAASWTLHSPNLSFHSLGCDKYRERKRSKEKKRQKHCSASVPPGILENRLLRRVYAAKKQQQNTHAHCLPHATQANKPHHISRRPILHAAFWHARFVHVLLRDGRQTAGHFDIHLWVRAAAEWSA